MSSYAQVSDYSFPTSGFTVEGFIKVQPGSGSGRFMFSYETTTGNCLLVASNVGSFGVWVRLIPAWH